MKLPIIDDIYHYYKGDDNQSFIINSQLLFIAQLIIRTSFFFLNLLLWRLGSCESAFLLILVLINLLFNYCLCFDMFYAQRVSW